MSDKMLGIVIIAAIIILGFASGGKIFRPITIEQATSTPQTSYPDDTPLVTEEPIDSQYTSSFRNKIGIQSVINPGSFNEYIVLYSNLDETEQITITGWKLRSTVTGREVYISGGANVPYEGLRDERPITVSDNTKIIVSQGRSPIGTSFRINKCAGYFEQNHNFSPSISTSCPAPIDDAPPLSRNMNQECLDYIEGLPRCEIPRSRDYPKDENGRSELPNACESYLENRINYNSCVANHINDEDFFESEWRVYNSRNGIFWLTKRDNIELIDTSGRIVDSISY